MNPTQKTLIAVLLNQSLDAIGDRDDAAMHLIDHPDDETMRALVTVGSNENENEGLIGACGEALGAILAKNPDFDRSVVDRLQPMAKLEALAYLTTNDCNQ